MAQQNYRPWSPGMPEPFVPVLPSRVAPSMPIAGNGPPEGQTYGNPGQLYQDNQTGDIYQKFSGTAKFGWQKVGTGGLPGGSGGGTGSGKQQVFVSNGNPNGQVSCTGPGMCYDVSTSPNTIWIKTTATTSTTDWFILIGG
jgi:hypothetical protein